MTDEPEDFRLFTRLFARKLQRVGVEMSGMPLEQHDKAFVATEQWLREIANRWSPGDAKIDDFVNNAMNSLRQFVTDQTR